MGLDDKIGNKSEGLGGKVKEGLGKASGDDLGTSILFDVFALGQRVRVLMQTAMRDYLGSEAAKVSGSRNLSGTGQGCGLMPV